MLNCEPCKMKILFEVKVELKIGVTLNSTTSYLCSVSDNFVI